MDDPHALSHQLTRQALGLDQLYRAAQEGGPGKLDAEGLIPVHWSALEAETLADWNAAEAALQRSLRAATLLPDPWARDWLSELALSLLTLVRWFAGEQLGYEQLVAGALRVDPRPPSAARLQAERERRDRTVRAAGYRDFADYQARKLVPADQVEATMLALIAEAERRTRARLPQLSLPEAPIGVRAVRATPFSAYCDYPGRQVWINLDVPYTAADLKQLVGHEAYPGHYAHMGHRDALVAAGAMAADGALVITNSASSALFEGIAERGLDLLGWRDTPEDAIAWRHNRLQWLASIEAAHALNTGRATPVEIAALLRDLCDADEAWIEGKIAFVTHRLRAPFVYAYWHGGSAVGRWWRTVPADRFDAATRYLYDRMHSPSTLDAHWHPEETP